MTGLAARGLIPRPALMDHLEGAAGRPVTVVCAPAGSGKTQLVRSWLERGGPAQKAAWISVERGERDAQRFLGAVVTGLRAAAPAGVTIETLEPTPSFDGRAVVRRLISELASLEERIVLVIDDLHELVGPEVLDPLEYLLDHLPEAVPVVLITRRDPQLGLHRRRLAGELTEIRNRDLRFTLEETRAMLSASGILLSDEGVEQLQDRTEGWVAGLRLAAMRLHEDPDPEGFVGRFSGSDRTVAEYLLAEVLDNQPADVRRLLVRTSLLERVNGPLGDLFTQGSGAERHLRALADAGVFVVALDPEGTWFRFHHLIADLLRVQLRYTEPDVIEGLHLTAATWFAEHGQILEAIAQAQAAGDRELAAGLLIEHYFTLTLDGRRATAHTLLESFVVDPDVPSAELATVVAAEQLAQGSLDQAAAYLALAEQDAGSVPEHRRHRFGMAHLITRLTLARRLGDFRSVLEEVPPAGALAEARSSRDISMHNDVRALALMNLGIVEVWSGRVDEGARHLDEARRLAQQIGRPYLEVACRAHGAQAMTWRSFTRAREDCREAIALAESHGWGSDPVIGPALVTMGASLLQAGRVSEAEQWLARADQTLRSDLEPAVGFLLHMVHGTVHLVQGRHAEAIASCDAAERLGVLLVTGSPLDLQLRCSRLYALRDAGDIPAVREALDQMSRLERAQGEVRDLLAGLALADGDAETASALLAPTLDGSADVHHPTVVVRSLLLEALAREALGEIRAGEDAVERALDLAEPDGLILPFMLVPSRELLEGHPGYRTAHGAFIAEILDALSGGPLAAESAAPAPAIDSLSDAESRVLSFLPTNLPASGIAAELFVSANTVKTHMRHIYAKLDAHNRAEAVARARELGLLGRSHRHD